MIPTETKEYKDIHKIIVKHLEKDERDYEIDPEYKTSRFVVDLCKDVHEYIASRNDEITIDEVLRLDTFCSGHIDYHKKFALRSYELLKYGHTTVIF